MNMDVLRRDIQARIGTIPNPAPTPRLPVPIGESADVLLFRGSEGPQVAELQRRLKYGYNEFAGHLEIDGVYTPPTEAALRLRILPRGQLRLVADNEPA